MQNISPLVYVALTMMMAACVAGAIFFFVVVMSDARPEEGRSSSVVAGKGPSTVVDAFRDERMRETANIYGREEL